MGRPAWSSVNLITSHDGFTLRDCVRYKARHNLANLEDGKDGHGSNYSDNLGAEGETEDSETLALRRQRQRNMLATLFFSQGTPMLLAGDEISNSQGGNNNAYCQDNAIGWVDWANADTELLDFKAELVAFRKRHPCFRQRRFLHRELRESGTPDVQWIDFSLQDVNWDDSCLSRFCLLIRGSAESTDQGCTRVLSSSCLIEKVNPKPCSFLS